MRNLTLFLSVIGVVVPAMGCGGGQTRTDMAAERAIQFRDERYQVVSARQDEVLMAEEAVAEAERSAAAAEEAENVLTSHSPEAITAACDILAATPAPPPIEEVAEVSDVEEE